MTGTLLPQALSPFPSFMVVQRSFFSQLTAVSAFYTWQMTASVKVFSVSIFLFPKRGQKGQAFLELVSLRKLFRIASFLSRLMNAYNPRLSAIVQHNLAIILCLFHLENPLPIKVIQPSNTCSQLNLSCITCLDAAGHRFLPLPSIH